MSDLRVCDQCSSTIPLGVVTYTLEASRTYRAVFSNADAFGMHFEHPYHFDTLPCLAAFVSALVQARIAAAAAPEIAS